MALLRRARAVLNTKAVGRKSSFHLLRQVVMLQRPVHRQQHKVLYLLRQPKGYLRQIHRRPRAKFRHSHRGRLRFLRLFEQ